MAIMLNLEPETEAQLAALAEAHGQTVEEYLRSVIDERILEEPIHVPPINSGAELVEYWKREGVIGAWANRKDITDSVEYARKLRKQAETRERAE